MRKRLGIIVLCVICTLLLVTACSGPQAVTHGVWDRSNWDQTSWQ